MDFLYSVFIRPHIGLYDYGSAKLGYPLPIHCWPSTTLIVTLGYLLLVKRILPAYMANRKAYDLRTAMLILNGIQVVFNTYLAVNIGLELARQGDILFTGCPTRSRRMDYLCVVSVINKYMDLIDTVIFVLRKNHRQVTFLHVYHHVAVMYYVLMAFMEEPGGYPMFTGLLNTSIHAVMYMYYFVSIYDKRLTQHMDNFKKHLTQAQLIQFGINILWFLRPSIGLCKWPKYLAYAGVVQNIILIGLFSNFYYHAYYKKTKAKSI